MAMMMLALCLVACTSQKKEEQAKKVLVLYYSQTGCTKTVAEEIAQQMGADIEAIDVVTPYDGDFQQTIERCQKEMAEGVVPEINDLKSNIENYDLIFVGYPVWFGTYAMPIAGLLKKADFAGKKVVTFCTFGSGGLLSSTEALKTALPDAEVTAGYGVRGVRMDAVAEEVNRFLVENGYKEGEVEALPAFMEHHPVTDDEIAVFDEACSDYSYPLGTPVDVAIRETATSTDYEFSASAGKDAEGNDIITTIYVTVEKKEGSKAIFTQVVK